MEYNSVMLNGSFVKQLYKFCEKKHKFGVLTTPWYADGCVCASDGVRCVRLHLNDDNRLGEHVKPFSFNAAACDNAKKGNFTFNERYISVNDLPVFEIEQDKYEKYPDFDRLFESMQFDDSNQFSVWCDASLVADVCNLASSLGRKSAIKFSFSKCAMHFEFDTPWGKCEGIVMMITH